MPREEKGQVGKKFGAEVGDRGYLSALLEKQAVIQGEINRLGASICKKCGLKEGTQLDLQGDFWVVVKEPPAPPPAPKIVKPQPQTE